ncbi:AAA family ATPase [Cellulosimicrobium composti]|uniref:AAA family ATPase n=1 Tax=Cellulosimicrobium composti TaxID=2672572 RepID=A0ABX0BDR2_9MICO|nr:AAA family ATPase [Cellulosimicrobium composti]NDO90654.1 AAA family ATPase [Cellulosimicrobium composti]
MLDTNAVDRVYRKVWRTPVPKLTSISITGLFGYADHKIAVRPNSPTIITAPNGAGKTHVLSITKHALALDIDGLSSLPFEKAVFDFNEGQSMIVERGPSLDEKPTATYSLVQGGKTLEGPAVLSGTRTEDGLPLPTHLEERPDGNWFDTRSARVVSRALIENAYRVTLPESRAKRFDKIPQILQISTAVAPILIDTKRLDAPAAHEVRGRRERDPNFVVADRIHRYVQQIRVEVVQARRASIRATQESDISFAMRALAVAKKTINERKLHARYDRIVASYERLSRNGLAVGEELPPFPESTTPTVRRILSPFLDDWEARLQPLLPLNEKLETLRDILDTKLRESGKRTTIDSDGRLGFESFSGRRIRVSSLSSGEQHLVALFTALLFTASEDSIVLIDEPEISMHIAWQHAFLEDISRVASVRNHQVILATHSTAIVNGRWDIEEALELRLPPDLEASQSDDFDFDIDDLLGGME